MEDLKWLAGHLPETVNGALEEELMMRVYDERDLGDSLILYSRESVEWAPPFERTMDEQAWERRRAATRKGWGARCTCCNCQEDFYTGYVPGKERKGSGITLAVGEDGMTYAGNFPDDPMVMTWHEGDDILCPLCNETGELTQRRDLRNGRTYGILQVEVRNIKGYTAVLYWMVRRFLDDEGGDHICATPRDALVIDRNGKLQRFVHTTHGQFGEKELPEWRWSGAVREPAMIAYHNWGAVNNRQVGAWIYDDVPNLTGSTGEKSALEVYIRHGGKWPGIYLKLWQRHPNVENLMRGGFSVAVIESIERTADTAISYGDRYPEAALTWCDWREVKPFRMVGMTKEDWRSVRTHSWGEDTLRTWRLWQLEEKKSVAAYLEAMQHLSQGGVRDILEMRRAGWNGFDPEKVARYLVKQNRRGAPGVEMLIDYRKMLRDARLDETEETLWPRSLQEAHDRVVEYKLAHAKDIYQKGFTEAAAKYAALEWTDGDLRIVVPRIEEELKEEGRVLRHCVGTYGASHVAGSPIFFVRKYRRPERSYYTLNINLTGRMPKEVQLHGYGNERHGPHKEYSHRIPRKVREFVDRWKREVLTPWWAEQKQAETQQKKKKKEKTA